jgi:hypothetical protein
MFNHSNRNSNADIAKPAEQAAGKWEYKVVQMVGQTPADAAGASRKLGGTLSPEALKAQFPEHYGGVNGRKQINDFLNLLGEEGWELVQVQQIGDLPLMVFKRPKQLAFTKELARGGEASSISHAEST